MSVILPQLSSEMYWVQSHVLWQIDICPYFENCKKRNTKIVVAGPWHSDFWHISFSTKHKLKWGNRIQDSTMLEQVLWRMSWMQWCIFCSGTFLLKKNITTDLHSLAVWRPSFFIHHKVWRHSGCLCWLSKNLEGIDHVLYWCSAVAFYVRMPSWRPRIIQRKIWSHTWLYRISWDSQYFKLCA
jgi:hypothetical protein